MGGRVRKGVRSPVGKTDKSVKEKHEATELISTRDLKFITQTAEASGTKWIYCGEKLRRKSLI